MKKKSISRATLGRLPMYLQYLKERANEEYVSSSAVANALQLGEVLVRKDLASVCDGGRPKLGYRRKELIDSIEDALGSGKKSCAVIVGAGRLGSAILGYGGFTDYGIEIAGAFDTDTDKSGSSINGRNILPADEFEPFCASHEIRIGIITVPVSEAQAVCDRMIKAGITAIWNFAPITLSVPSGVTVKNENLALSLAHLNTMSIS